MKKSIVFILILVVILMAFIPLFAMPDREFGGSDYAGIVVVEEVDSGYRPWFEPIFEKALGHELPGEIESLLFCIQTGIGVGIIAFVMGRYVERRKWLKEE